MLNEKIIIGKIGSCYGTRGWLRIFSFTEKSKDIFIYHPWFIQQFNKWKTIKIENWCYHREKLIVKFKNIHDRNCAYLFINCKIAINASQLPVLTKGNIYWKDLIKCQVITDKGYHLGTVVNIMETGSNDVLIVKAPLQDTFKIEERLIPFIERRVIKKVDLNRKIIKVDWNPIF